MSRALTQSSCTLWWRHNKSNMADGRHFENRYISISQPRIVRIWQNLVCGCNFWPKRRKCEKIPEIPKFKTADGRHIENHFLAITRLPIVRLRQNLEFGGLIACIQRFDDENSNFENPRWRTAAILKIVIAPYLSRELSEFDEIWYADSNIKQGDRNVTKIQKFPNSRWRTEAILKIIFAITWLHIGLEISS